MDTYDDSFEVWFGVSDPNFELYDNPYITVDFLTQTGGKPRPAPHISLKPCDESGFESKDKVVKMKYWCLADKSGINMYSRASTMLLAVNYCKNTTESVCKPEEEIDRYIQKVNWFVGVNEN